MSDDAPKSFISLIPDSVNNATKNLTDLPSKGIGQTLADCWFLIFGGISQCAEKRRTKYDIELSNFKKELEKSLTKVSPENQVEPSSQIILSALDEAKYCVEEEELRKLFVSLITSSIDCRKNVHPSFAPLIKQMSPNDARLFRDIYNRLPLPLCDIHETVDKGILVLFENLFVDGSETISEIQKSICISSLIRLGLLQVPPTYHINDRTCYNRFENSQIFSKYKANNPDKLISLEHKLIELTPLGRSFVSCCLDDSIGHIPH